MADLFGFGGGSTGFQLVGFDTSVLDAAYSARVSLRNSSSLRSAQTLTEIRRSTPAIAPWQLPTESRSLALKIAEARGLKKFIDPDADSVKSAKGDKDSKALFTLFNALTHLETLAQYASEAKTPAASLAALNAKFQQGLAEVRKYIDDAPLEKLWLFEDRKTNQAVSKANIGKNRNDYYGKIIQKGFIGDSIAGVAGNETFTITLSKQRASGPVSNTVTVDLSEISGPVNLRTITDLANAKIAAILDPDSGTRMYATKLVVRTDENGDHGLTIDGVATETVALDAAAAPALVVVGSTKGFQSSDSTQATLTRVEDLAGTGAVADRTILASSDEAATALKSAVDSFLKVDPKYDFQKSTAEAIGKTEDAAAVGADISATRVAVDGEGFVYMLATADGGSYDGQRVTATTKDVVLSKFDQSGNLLFARVLGAADSAEGFALTIDGNDNVIVAGRTNSALSGTDAISGTDSFVTKFNSRGDELFTYQVDTAASDGAFAVTTDAAGDIFIAGETSGAVSATSGFGGGTRDAYVMKISGTTGARLSAAVYGGTNTESARAMTIADDGNLLIAGIENGEAIVRKIDAADLTSTLYSQSLGTLNGDIGGIRVDGAGGVYIAGTTSNASFGGNAVNSASGDSDGFVVKLNDSGSNLSIDFTSFVGSSGTDRVSDLVVQGGSVYLAGTTKGTLAGAEKQGLQDGFVAKIDAGSGAIAFAEQFGKSASTNTGAGIAFTSHGTSILTRLGLTAGTLDTNQTRDLEARTSIRPGDYFEVSVNGKAFRKIVFEDGDTLKDLIRKLKLVDFRRMKADISITSTGDQLRITAEKDAEIELRAGAGGRDLLAKLGMKPGTLLPTAKLYDMKDDEVGADEDKLGGAFAFGLTNLLNISDKRNAQYALNQISTAMQTVQRAFRSLTFDPTAAYLKEQAKYSGPIPANLQSQLSNYQNALFRLQASNYTPPASLLT